MMKEPSVLDYLKAKLFFWHYDSIEFPFDDNERETNSESLNSTVELKIAKSTSMVSENNNVQHSNLFWRGWWVFPTLGFALLGQRFLEPPVRTISAGVVCYVIAAILLFWGNRDTEPPEDITQPMESKPNSISVNALMIGISLVTSLAAFIAFDENLFTWGNVFLWAISILTICFAFWNPEERVSSKNNLLRIRWERFKYQGLQISPWMLMVIIVFGIAFFFRFYQLEHVPLDMFSDHAEKLMDVSDVLAGETRIFFPRNTGREAFQIYLSALVALVFDTGISFQSLKIGTAIAGLLTLPFIYLLGKEVASRRVGLLAMAFAGVAIGQM